MIKPEDVTIIIPHLFGVKESEYSLGECLISLEETVPEIKRIVVHNGFSSGEEIYMMTQPKHPIIWMTNQGQCKAVNAAAATVNTPWIFVTNDDMVYPPGWWEKLGQLTEVIDPKTNRIVNVKCVSPKLIEPRQGAPTFEVYFCGGAGGDFDKTKWLEFAKNYKRKTISILMDGFNLPFLIKKELWDTVGGYDINYDPWGSNGDSDLEYKIRLAGVQPYQNTNCLVYHFSQTSGTFHPDNQSYWQKNWDYFIEKWGFPRTDDGIWEANFKMPETPIRKFRPDWEAQYGPVNK